MFPNPAEVQKRINDGMWMRVQMKDIRKGDIFRMYDNRRALIADKKGYTQFEAIKDAVLRGQQRNTGNEIWVVPNVGIDEEDIDKDRRRRRRRRDKKGKRRK